MAVTGKPMVFYAYDLDHYRDSLRGFYFDLLAEASGPVVGTLPALLEALSRPDALREEYEDPYARFRERYCHLDDGHATARVIELLLPGRQVRKESSPGRPCWWPGAAGAGSRR